MFVDSHTLVSLSLLFCLVYSPHPFSIAYSFLGTTDNPRFGLNDWHEEWDGVQDEYQLGQHLDEDDMKNLASAPKKPKLG
jgi:hypothetical protein